MPPVTLREFFLKRVIHIDAVKRECDTALEESRQCCATSRLALGRHGDVVFTARRIVTPEDIEKLSTGGIIPGVSDWWRPLWPIGTAEPSKPPPKLTAVERALLVALGKRSQLVRELWNDTLVVTGTETLHSNRQKIGPETWFHRRTSQFMLPGVWFDVSNNRICTIWQIDGFDSPKVIPLWLEVQVHMADEAAEFEGDQPAKEDAPSDQCQAARAAATPACAAVNTQPRESPLPPVRGTTYNWPKIVPVDADCYWRYVDENGVAPSWEKRAEILRTRDLICPDGEGLRKSNRVDKVPPRPNPEGCPEVCPEA
jgi:hypothetical protein